MPKAIRGRAERVEMIMGQIVGIDLGTTNSAVAVMEAGFPILLADDQGRRLTPSVVHFPKDGRRKKIVGWEAQRMLAVEPERTIHSSKRFIGRRSEDVSPDDEETVGYRLKRRKGEAIHIIPGKRKRGVSPEQVAAQVLEHLKSVADQRLDDPVTQAVITVPAYFNDAQRTATRRAGELAGLEVARIINEPTAAALAYGLNKLKEHSKIAVYDFGGGTFDLSILELQEGVFQVLSTHGDTRLGGDDIDQALTRYLTRLAADQFSQDVDEIFADTTFQSRLREAAQQAKISLSDKEEMELSVPFAGDEGDRNFVCNLSRKKLEEIARPIVERTRRCCLHALNDANLKPENLDQVILVGGSTRMPLVRRLVREIFQREPNTSQNPDEAVAIGAAIQGAILSGQLTNVLLLDVTPLSLGIETFGGLMNVIIPRNSTIPCKAGELFTNALAMQKSMLVRILQGEREMARDNWELGKIDIPFSPAPKGQARVGVQFEIDADGILRVLVRDTHSGEEQSLDIQSAVDVSDEAVEQMIEESVEHAFEDMNERIWTETKMKTNELLPSVETALALAGDELDAKERRHIEELANQAQQALNQQDTQKLRRLNKDLDEATQNLATLLMEKALDQLSNEDTPTT